MKSHYILINPRSSLAVLGVVLLLLQGGCASRPDAIAPAPVSAVEYQGLTCSELTSLLAEKREALREAERQQNRAATGDAIGVFLVLLPVGSAFGGDNEGGKHCITWPGLKRWTSGSCSQYPLLRA